VVTGINHIGLCVNSIDDTLAQWKDAFGVKVVKEKKEFPGNQLSCLIDLGGTMVELMEPTGPGTVQKYLENHGEGLHHISLAVDDVTADLDRFEQSGMGVMRFPEMKAGFIKPKGNHGLLCEVSEGDM
jgi:methylmalonyl-CoA/ethylmalonyl-CoA epimerase